MESKTLYQYYKFEAKCPLTNETEQMFWDYERSFAKLLPRVISTLNCGLPKQ